jgi:hypothetical protein
MATITVRGDFVHPESKEVEIGEQVLWVGPPGSIIGITFGRNTPVEWRSREESPGVPVRGTIQGSTAFGTYKYRVGDTLTTMSDDPEFMASDPEIIVSGGVLQKPARPATKRTRATTRVKATKRTKTKRTKTTKRTKATTRTKATKRTKAATRGATKRAKPARRAKSTKRAKKR